MSRKTDIFYLLFSIICVHSYASDTLRITLRQADSLFLSGNYYLLASAMNIEAQKAQVLQAGVYPNPVFTADLNAYDPEHGKVMHTGQSGQKGFQLEQLIVLGGKRKSEIEIAKTNADIAALEFQDLVRQLKYRLHKNLFALGQQQHLLAKYNTQLILLDSIVAGFEKQVARGSMPLKDLVRLRGVYLSLNNDRAELLKQYFEAQGDIQALLQVSGTVVFLFSDDDIAAYIKTKDLEELKEEALNSHPELLAMRQNRRLAEQYLQYQKRSAVPDISLFASYDQRGGAFNNQINAGLSVPLPLWNRNQGNIRAAGFRIRETDYHAHARQQEIVSNLQNSFALYAHTVQEYRKASELYNQDFEVILKGISENFQKRNISLIEFVDFFEAYNDALAELARIKTQLVSSAELLNLSIGKDIY